jgi:CHAT domain-containing protein
MRRQHSLSRPTVWRSRRAGRLLAFCAATASFAAGAQEPDRGAVDKAFEYAQLATLSESTVNLNASAVLASRGDSVISAWEGERQAALAELARAERDFDDALVANGDPAVRNQISERRASLLADIDAIESRIRDRDPAYWDLIHPEAVSLAGLQRLLNADEALLLIVTFDKKSYSFAVTAKSANWSRIDGYGSSELQSDVDVIRSGIRDEIDGHAEPGAGIDLDRAHRIYANLVAPLEKDLEAKARIFTVVSGPLSALPIGLLPRKPRRETGNAQWMADGRVTMSLASVSMLRAQRCLLVDQGNRHADCAAAGAGRPGGKSQALPGQGFLGIGNPSIGQAGSRSVQPPGLTGDWMTRGIANRDMLLRMPSLPGTERELKVAAQSFGAAQSRLLMGDEAGEPNVRGTLREYRPRFIAFATHGLLASEAGGLSEPGLVLTPPADNVQSDNDGFLSASEIAQFGLARAIVILSACNTGTEERGMASRNLNSVARAFQFAGAHEVIASHWSVSDEATARLMEIFFRKIAAGPDLPVAVAFQESQAELRRDPRWASPAFWASFSIIGADN